MKALALLYALGGYALGVASSIYIVGFMLQLGVPKHINSGPAAEIWPAALLNLGLVWLFGLHHSVTARTRFKAWWTKLVPAPVERATYLYMTALMTAVLVWFWQPIPITVWQVEHPVAVWSFYIGFAVCGLIMGVAVAQFGQFRFLGLTQAWDHFKGDAPTDPGFSDKLLYGVVRHPISVGWLLIVFMTPHMTVGHLVFAVGVWTYIFAATPFEEADLLNGLGDVYAEYKTRVKAFLPF